ncbi:MAG: flagellar filament capping protein FliD [Pseudomonadota bacterium]
MASTTYLSGLASSFDWASVVDQLMAVEQKKIDVVSSQKTTSQTQQTAWNSVNGMISTFKTAVNTLRTVEAFNKVAISASTNSATYEASDLVKVTADNTASPGSHVLQMTSGCQLATARQVSSKSFSSNTDALGLSGEFVVNGRTVKVESTYSLNDISSRINALNSGSNATHVTASVLVAEADADYRLVLTADNTGADNFDLKEGDSSNILRRSGGLGFFESYSNEVKHATSDGAQSDQFTSSTVAIKNLLGLTGAAGTTTVQIGGHNVSINLSSATETLTTIAAKIDTALGASGSASVVSETNDGTTYSIDINGTTTLTDSSNVLQTLGLVKGTQTDVAKTLLAGNTLYTKASGGTAKVTEATLFSGISGYTQGATDTISIGGYTHDGVALTATSFAEYSSGYKTIGNLCTAIEGAYAAAGETVDASVVNGRIQVMDSTTGASQLSLSLVANNQGGGNLDFGDMALDTEGYAQQVSTGQNAKIKIDGIYVEDSSNTISEAITGLDIDLLRMETGTTVNLTVARDYAAIKASVQGVVDKYNAMLDFANQQFTFNEDAGTSGPLSGDFTLRDVKDRLQTILTQQISGLPSGWNAFSLIGVESDSNGILAINSTLFNDMARSDFNAFRRVMGTEGTVTDADITYTGYGNNTQAGTYDINITQAADQAEAIGTEDLTGGLGGDEEVRLTDLQTGREATVNLTSGSNIDEVVAALNSEFDAVTTEVLVGDVANEAVGEAATTAEATGTKDLTSGIGATDEEIKVTNDLTGRVATVTLTAGSDIDDVVSALNTEFDTVYTETRVGSVANNEAGTETAAQTTGTVDLTSGCPWSTTDNYKIVDTENSQTLICGFAPWVTIADRVSSLNAFFDSGGLNITASNDGSGHLVLTHDHLGPGAGIAVSTVGGGSGKCLLYGSANTTASSGGTVPVSGSTGFDNIYGYTANTTDTITISGTNRDGGPVNESFNIFEDGNYNTIDDLCAAIQDAFGGYVVSAYVDGEGGALCLEDQVTGYDSLMTLNLTVNATDPTPVDFGAFGSNSGLVNGTYVGGEISSEVMTADTTWDSIDGATLENGDQFTFSGTDHDGNAVNGSHTITNITTGTVQDLLSALETAFGVDASIDASGRIVVQDTESGDSSLTVSITPPVGSGLDFGAINVTATLVGSVANNEVGTEAAQTTGTVDLTGGSGWGLDSMRIIDTENSHVLYHDFDFTDTITDRVTALNSSFDAQGLNITASNDGRGHLVLTHDHLGPGAGIEFSSTYLGGWCYLHGSVNNHTASSGGTIQLSGTTGFNDIYGYTANTTDTITISGTKSDGEPVNAVFNVFEDGNYNTIDDLCGAIQDAFGMDYSAYSTGSGTFILRNSHMYFSQMTLDLTVNTTDPTPMDFGAFVGGSGLANGSYVGGEIPSGVMTADTTWDSIDGATLENGDQFTFSGTDHDGNAVSDSYTITDAETDTVQDLLSALETAFGVDASIDASGRIVVRDTESGDSSLTVSITPPVGSGLDFGTINVTTGAVEGRDAVGITASNDGSGHLVLTDDTSGEGADFTVEQVSGPSGTNKGVLSSDTASYTASSGGTVEVIDTTAFDNIFGYTADASDTITISGTTHNGAALTPTDFDVYSGGYKTFSQLLTAIQNAYSAAGGSVTASIENGKIKVVDNTTGLSETTLSLTVNAVDPTPIDLGVFGSKATGLANGSYSGTGATGGFSADTIWEDINGTTLSNGDTFTFEGTSHDGTALDGAYTISNVSTGTVQDLLSAIEATFGGAVQADIDASGRLILRDTESGDSSLSLTITTPVGSGLDFGTVDYTAGAGDSSVAGRGAMGITASDDGSGHVVLTHDEYGAEAGFTIDEAGSYTGLLEGTYIGEDVAGTINGEACTGGGQVLTGDIPDWGETSSVQGISLMVSLTPEQLLFQGSSQGTVTLTLGGMEQFWRAIDALTDSTDGGVTLRLSGIADRISEVDDLVSAMNDRLAQKREQLTRQFVALEQAMAHFKSLSSWLSSSTGFMTGSSSK